MEINNKKQFINELKNLEQARRSALAGSSIYYRDMLYDAYKQKVKALGFFKRKSSLLIVIENFIFLALWLGLVYVFGNYQPVTVFCLGCIFVVWCGAYGRIYDDHQEMYSRRKDFAPDLIEEFTLQKDALIERIHNIQAEIQEQKTDPTKKVDPHLKRVINGLSEKIKFVKAEIEFLKSL